MTHLPISSILNAAKLTIYLEIQGCLDNLTIDYEKAPFQQGVSSVDHQSPALRPDIIDS